MKKSTLLATLTAAGLAFAVAACDQQQADSGDGATAPLQQQGAVPADPATESLQTTPPQSDAIEAAPTDEAPQSDMPAPSSDTQ